MKECPQCHTIALDTDKFCKTCGTPLDDVPEEAAAQELVQTETQTPEPAESEASVSEEAAAPAAKAKPAGIRRPILIAAAAVVLLAVIIGVILSQRKGGGSKEIIEISPDEAREALAKIYDSREFDEAHDLSKHPGLLSAEQVTGPFLEIRKKDGSYYVPDTVANPDAGKKLPDDAEIVAAKKDSIPGEYKELLQTGKNVKRAAKGKEDVVYALMEYTGYGTAGRYNNGNFILYYHNSRVSYYDLETNEMLGWVTTSASRTGPFILYTNNYGSDGQHPILNFKEGGIWSDTAWTNGLNELFYDENGYQVVGDKLMDVPDKDVLEIPEGVREIADNVGQSHRATELILPDGLERIGASAFSQSGLKEITFPDSLTYVDSGAFSGCEWMTGKESQEWVVIGDGVLLHCHSDEKELTVPDDVRYIMPEAFSGLSCRKITIPKSVTQCCGSIRNETTYTIANLESLEEVVFEGGLEQKLDDVPIRPVGYCNNLKQITIDCETGETEDNWIILNPDTYKNLRMICKDDSPAAKWADTHQVSHQEK